MSGCSDFLDKLPENTVAQEKWITTNLNNMYMPVSGVYAVAAFKFLLWGAYGLIAIRGDDVDKGSAPNDQIEFNYAKQFQYDRITGFGH